MKLIIGGYAQGKLKYAIEKYGLDLRLVYSAYYPLHFFRLPRKLYKDSPCPFPVFPLKFLYRYDSIYPELEPVCIPEWKEIDFGAFEGKNYQELKEDKRYQEWIDKNGALPFPQGESRESFIRRCEKGFQRMLKEIAEMKKYSMDMGNNEIEGRRGKKTIGMIVHGGTIMALLSQYGDEDYFDYQTANGRGYICTWTKENGKAVFTDIRKL